MSEESSIKLSKKELKTLEHKAKSDAKAQAKLDAYHAQENAAKESAKRALEEKAAAEAEALANAPPKKKRKTRRGKGGKGKAGSGQTGFKATLFIGNVPKDLTEETLREHFKSAEPFDVRMRLEKGFCFVEFQAKGDNELDKAEIHRRTQIALLLHHTKLGGRTINVELSAGGGGNSAVRREKIVKKNELVEKERKKRIAKEQAAQMGETVPEGVNPERLRMIQQQQQQQPE